MDERFVVLSVLIGLAMGLVQTLFGLGGGIILVPALGALLALPPRMAIATALATTAPVAMVNSYRLLRLNVVDRMLALKIGAASVVGTAIAVQLTGKVQPSFLLYGFSLVCLMMALQLLTRPPDERFGFSGFFDGAVGFSAGLISGFTGVSGGIVTSAYLQRHASGGPNTAVPTAVAAMTLTSIAGTAAFALSEGAGTSLIQWHLVPVLAASALLSSMFGIRMQAKLPQRLRLAVLGSALLGLAVQTFLRALTS